MELKTKIKITVATAIAVLLAMTITAGAICLPHTDRNIHGHYRGVDMNNSRR